MTYKTEKTILLAQDCPISILSYSVENPEGIFLMLHGMCEHKERYEYFMEKLAIAGYSSYIYDHRGHGESIASLEDLGHIGNKKYDTLVEDAHQILQFIKSKNPGCKVFLFSHSMGSLVARAFIKKYDNEIEALILSGHPYKVSGLAMGSVLVKLLESLKGARAHSKLLDSIALGGYEKSFASEGKNAWLSSISEAVSLYDNDPLCGFRFTINSYGHLLALQKSCYGKCGWEMKNAKLPILLLAGEDDPCAGDLEHFRGSVMSLKRTGYENVRWKRYSGNRHEVLNDAARDTMIRDIIRFIAAL